MIDNDNVTMGELQSRVNDFKSSWDILTDEVNKVISGQAEVVKLTLTTLFAGGNALLEGVPGLGKTLLVRTLSDAMALNFSRIQFTPDLMPADIVGTNIIDEDDSGRKRQRFIAGPVFTNLLLADEINRATPKTQSALLEVMQEQSVTVLGELRKLEKPFFVLATQNPLEQEGTYPLPEAQLDRFMFKIDVQFPDVKTLTEIMERTTGQKISKANPVLSGSKIAELQDLVRMVIIAPHVLEYAVRLGVATHPDSPEATPMIKKYVRYGGSPRAIQSMVLAAKVAALIDGRLNVSFSDLKQHLLPALRHRIILNFEAEADGLKPDAILTELGANLKTTTEG